MLIWRSLSPKAILDCIDYLLPRPDKEKSPTTAPVSDAQREIDQRVDQATTEIESRL